MNNASVAGSEIRDEALPSYSDCGGVYLLSEPSDLGTDSEDSITLEDCEAIARHVGRWAKAAFTMSVFSLAVSLLILTSIFLLSW